MGVHSDNRLPISELGQGNAFDVRGVVGSDYNFNSDGNKRTMATAIKLFFSSPLANYLGWSLTGFWLFIDFNDIKMIVLGVTSMIFVTIKGFLSLYSQYMKIQREKIDLDEYRELKKLKKTTETNTGKSTKK